MPLYLIPIANVVLLNVSNYFRGKVSLKVFPYDDFLSLPTAKIAYRGIIIILGNNLLSKWLALGHVDLSPKA